MPLTRQQVGNIYRPQGPKAAVLSTTFAPATGGSALISGPQFDLSVPIEGFRFVIKLRDVIGTANMTSMNPFAYLNLISRILVTGKNSRTGGNATLWDIDLPALAMIQSSIKPVVPFVYNGVSDGVITTTLGAPSAGCEAAPPGSPMSPRYGTGVTGTYDIRIEVDLPSHPFHCADYYRPGFYIRNQEWGDSLQMRITFGQQANGVAGVLGTDAGTTTHTFTSFGSGSGSPTLDVYELPAIMGTDLDPAIVPGFLSRVVTPVTTQLQSAGGVQTKLVTLEKQNTTRIWALIGVSTITPALSSVSDANMTTIGVVVGGNRVVRENDDIFAHRMDQVRRYGTRPIQGLTLLDFVPSGNPDSYYLGAAAGEGTTFEVRGTVAGVANAYGIFVQEIELAKPQGLLYSA